MTYDEIVFSCENLGYRDKLRLAQLMIQTARKEEENTNPQNRAESKVVVKKVKEDEFSKKVETIEYVVERLLKLKPTKKKSLTNSIKSMFQFQGGISESDIDKVISDLQRRKLIRIEQNKVSYL